MIISTGNAFLSPDLTGEKIILIKYDIFLSLPEICGESSRAAKKMTASHNQLNAIQKKRTLSLRNSCYTGIPGLRHPPERDKMTIASLTLLN